jgi:ABC-type nitrate/sulfonate/bicarbonate transport system ATPase subunit
VPTLSGGEAQRLKLAGHLVDADSESSKLFLFDEPTTGLHFDDVAKLLRAFRQLLDAGHSLIVIEHNLDVIRASDWIIDLGPEGGDAGGQLVAQGTPDEISRHPSSHTGKALREYQDAFTKPLATKEPAGRYLGNAIRIHKAREHNLKNIDVEIPRGRFTVVTGVSGSGKSTLAFDILFAEGQRRYLESLNAYARQFVQAASRPDVDAIFGIPPTVAIEQRTSRGGRKSTVGTLTEAHHFLRLLFVKLGTQYCPDCDVPIEPQSEEMIAARNPEEFPQPEDHPPRAAGRQSQRRLHRPRQVGARQGLLAPARRRQAAADAALPAPRPVQGAHHRASHRGSAGVGEEGIPAAQRAAEGARDRQGRGARAVRQGIADLLDQARLPLLRPQLPGARPAPLLLQLEARLVRAVLRHRSRDRRRRMDRRAGAHRRRGQRARFLDRVAGDRGRLPRVQGPPPQSRGAGGTLAGQEHRRLRGATDRFPQGNLQQGSAAGP